MASVNRISRRKTCIIIAHRLSTIEHCDMVFRVSDGSVIRER
jgi:ABC-type multidrug transport system fused ATPase/permease subunit